MPKYFVSVAEFGLKGTVPTKWLIRKTYTITITTQNPPTAKGVVGVYAAKGWIQGRDHEDAKQENETEEERRTGFGSNCVDASFAAVYLHG